MNRQSTLCYIEKDGKYLMLHRIVKKNDVNKDKWIGVGGHFEYAESPEECLLREVKEETGLDIVGCRYLFSIPNLYPYSGFEVHTVDMFFECLTESFDGAKAEDDAAEIIILPANQLNPDDFGLQSIKKAVDRYIK